jgi:hypothetical protein
VSRLVGTGTNADELSNSTVELCCVGLATVSTNNETAGADRDAARAPKGDLRAAGSPKATQPASPPSNANKDGK